MDVLSARSFQKDNVQHAPDLEACLFVNAYCIHVVLFDSKERRFVLFVDALRYLANKRTGISSSPELWIGAHGAHFSEFRETKTLASHGDEAAVIMYSSIATKLDGAIAEWTGFSRLRQSLHLGHILDRECSYLKVLVVISRGYIADHLLHRKAANDAPAFRRRRQICKEQDRSFFRAKKLRERTIRFRTLIFDCRQRP